MAFSARRQIREVAGRFGAALRSAQEMEKLREEFITIAAHELRTPLTALQLELQRIRRQVDNEQREPLFSEQLSTALRQTRNPSQAEEITLEVSNGGGTGTTVRVEASEPLRFPPGEVSFSLEAGARRRLHGTIGPLELGAFRGAGRPWPGCGRPGNGSSGRGAPAPRPGAARPGRPGATTTP